MAEPGTGVQPQALPRSSLQADAVTLAAGRYHDQARQAYVARFPEAALTFELADFSIVALQPSSARLVAGFGRAYGVPGGARSRWLLG